jgi:hypothetical protein
VLSIDTGGEEARAAAMKGFEHDSDLISFLGRAPGPGFHGISRDLIMSITFGCKMARADRDRVIALVRREGLSLKLYEAILHERKFSLVTLPVRV